MTLVQPNYARFVRVERAKMTTLTKAIKMIVGARVAAAVVCNRFFSNFGFKKWSKSVAVGHHPVSRLLQKFLAQLAGKKLYQDAKLQ